MYKKISYFLFLMIILGMWLPTSVFSSGKIGSSYAYENRRSLNTYEESNQDALDFILNLKKNNPYIRIRLDMFFVGLHESVYQWNVAFTAYERYLTTTISEMIKNKIATELEWRRTTKETFKQQYESYNVKCKDIYYPVGVDDRIFSEILVGVECTVDFGPDFQTLVPKAWAAEFTNGHLWHSTREEAKTTLMEAKKALELFYGDALIITSEEIVENQEMETFGFKITYSVKFRE